MVRPDVLSCPTCSLTLEVEPPARGQRAECPRCGSTVSEGPHGSLQATAALAVAALILYIPANIYPILRMCYERNGKFAGGAYNPVVRRLERFSEDSLGKAFKEHERHADLLMELDERVAAVIAKLKARGFLSPYLRAFVIARINPLRWMQGEPPPLEEVLKTMRERAGKFNTEKVKQEDLASVGGAPDESD